MEEYDFSGKKILITEDEFTNFLILKAMFKNTNADLVWAKSGPEAVAIINAQPDVDIVLMDMRMPGMGGMETATKIKKIRPDVVIIAQTAYALNNEREEILANGCDDFVSKPISSSVLLEMIDDYLKRQG